MPASSSPVKKRSSITGYHLFFSERRARLMEGANSKCALTQNQVRMIASQWRSLDTVSRVQYEWRSQHEEYTAQMRASCKATEQSLKSKKATKKKKNGGKGFIKKQKPRKFSERPVSGTQQWRILEQSKLRGDKCVSSTTLSLRAIKTNVLSTDQIQQQMSIALAIKELQTYKDDHLVAFMCETFL